MKTKPKRLSQWSWLLMSLSLGSVIAGTLDNSRISLSRLEIASDKLDPVFDDYTIVQISDLHNALFGPNQENLIAMILVVHPDLIVLTGDMVGNWTAEYDHALTLIRECAKIAPVMVVDGNHDARRFTYPFQKQAMEDAGATVLEDEALSICLGEASFNLIGLKERFKIKNRADFIAPLVDPTHFNLLLAHHPENFSDYVGAHVDLVLTGHAHGGQFRFFGIPIYAPDQGLFPKYTSGSYSAESTTMIVSRGIGESVLPLRLFNPPELVIINLRSTKNPD